MCSSILWTHFFISGILAYPLIVYSRSPDIENVSVAMLLRKGEYYMANTKTYDELEFTDDFMFGKVMEDKGLCRDDLTVNGGLSI